MNQVLKSFSLTAIPLLANNFKNAKNLSSIINKDLAKNSLLAHNTDLLINDLKSAKSIVNVFDLIKTHNKTMNSNHTIEALKTIFTLQKYGNSGLSARSILKHPDFVMICTQLKQQAGALELNQTLDALKIISFLGVPSTTTIYQILLQLLRHNLNEMSLQQIMFTDFLISKAETCPLIEALKIALPIVYEVQLPIKLHHTNFENLSEHLHYISKTNISEGSILTIVNKLMKVKVFNAKTSMSIIWSICDMQPNPILEPLLTKAIRSLMIVSNSMSYEDLETTISKLCQRYSAKMPFYYNEAFYDYCANVVIKDDLGFEHAVHLLRKFLKVNHLNIDLMNYISEKCYNNPDLIENGDPLLTYNVLCGCALTDFRPKYYDTIKESFTKIKKFNNFADKEFYLLRLQTALSILDIYIPDILKKLFNENYLRHLFKRNYMSDFENVLLISQAIKTFRPEFSNYLPSEDFLKYVKSQIRIGHENSIKEVMHHLFGDDKFVKTPASTKLFHHIDHLVVLKKGGQPCSLNATDLYVEDIKCEHPSQIVLIVLLKGFHYTINNRQHLGSTNLMLQTLEAKGYTIVPICLALWKNMPEVEKIPYIIEAIKEKTELYDQIYNVS